MLELKRNFKLKHSRRRIRLYSSIIDLLRKFRTYVDPKLALPRCVSRNFLIITDDLSKHSINFI